MSGVAAASTAGNDSQVFSTRARIQRTPDAAKAEAAASAAEASPDSALLNARDSDGRTRLMLAVMQGRTESVVELLHQGADPNAVDAAGVTPLQVARAQNKPEIIDALIRAGAR